MKGPSKNAKAKHPFFSALQTLWTSYVVLRGRMFYLWQYKSKASREKYNAVIAECFANGEKLPPTRTQSEITVEELAVSFSIGPKVTISKTVNLQKQSAIAVLHLLP